MTINELNKKDPVWQPPTIETQRLVLRPLTLDDAAAIFDYAKVPEVSRHTLWEPHQTIEDSKSFIQDYALPCYGRGFPEPLAITLKENRQTAIGTVGSFWTSKPAKAMEIAAAIAVPYWNQGLVSEACLAVMNYCAKEFGLKRIQGRCKVENKASAMLMEKIGMSFEGTMKSSVFHRERYWDIHIFAKIME